MAVMPPRKWSVIELTGKPYLRAITACEASCSSTDRYSTTANASPATYFQPPRPGWTSSTRGATRTATSPATRNQELETRTSLPAIDPIRIVPGGRRTLSDAPCVPPGAVGGVA
jgi:hypothetical protein